MLLIMMATQTFRLLEEICPYILVAGKVEEFYDKRHPIDLARVLTACWIQ